MNIKTKISICSLHLRHAIYIAHKGKCFYTGRKINFEDMDIDHIIPVFEGGKNCIENYVPTTFSLNRCKSRKIDFLLAERMVYINTIHFAPLVLKYYLDLHIKGEGYTQLRIYLKHYYHGLLRFSGLIHTVAIQHVSFLYKNISKKTKGKAFLFKKDEIEPFLLKCRIFFDQKNIQNKSMFNHITQRELNQWIKTFDKQFK